MLLKRSRSLLFALALVVNIAALRLPQAGATPAVAAGLPCEPELVVSAPKGTYRYATAADVAMIPQANIGDYILDGWNIGGSIYISTAPNHNSSFALGPGKKILIKGGSYEQIYLDIPNVQGSSTQPVVITNYGGKVSARSMTLLGAVNIKLTGRYDASAKTGDPNFLGWETNKPYYQGQFGFDIRNGWTNAGTSSLKVGGNASGYEIEYVEVGDGGFAGMMFKTDDGSVDMVNVKIHHNYIHDTDGEGIYLGSTQSDATFPGTNLPYAQHQFRNLRIYDNVIARSGLNTLQVGQLADNVLIERNVLITGAINWKNPFQRFQDQAVQFGLRRGGTTFRNNIVIGGASLVSAFLKPKPGVVLDVNAPFVIENNLFLYTHSPNMNYVESRGDNVTRVFFRNNYVGKSGNDATIVYSDDAPSAGVVWAAYNDITPHMTATGNRYDATVTSPFVKARGTAQLTASSNTLTTIALPRFRNFMELPPTFNYASIEKWNRAIGESPDFPASGTNKGAPIIYNVGDVVMYQGDLYRSKQNNNYDHQPQGATDAWWELVTFASTGSACIPDDVRLYTDDYYANQGIGLSRTVTPANWKKAHLPMLQQ